MFATLFSATLVSLLAIRGVTATLTVTTPVLTQVSSVAPPFSFHDNDDHRSVLLPNSVGLAVTPPTPSPLPMPILQLALRCELSLLISPGYST
jgi:hypothetical protein